MPRVLLVDDDAANLRLLEAVLAQDGHELIGVQSGEEALREVSRIPPDLVLLDLRMPGVDGFEVLEHLKAEPATRLVPVVVISGASERPERLRAVELGADDFLTKPVDAVELRARVRALLRLKHHVDELERAENVLLVLARAVEARDPELRDHCDRLAATVQRLGRALGLDEAELRTLRLGAYLHDIGKIGIADSVLLKPGPLNASERAMMRRHPEVGEAILRPLATLRPVLPLVRHHHERLDGSGYPDGLQGEQIPLLVRILSVADVYDALTTRRPYREGLTPEAAIQLLEAEAAQGSWDAAVVGCLKALVLS